MKKIQYFDILKKALLTTWDNKFLWLFGLFVFLGSFIPSSKMDNTKTWADGNMVGYISNKISSDPKAFMALGAVLSFLALIFFLFRIVATAAIIKSANDIILYRQLKVVEILGEAKKYFWRMFLLEMAVTFSVSVIALVLLIPVVYLFALNAKILGILATLGALVIIIPLLAIAYYLRRYSNIYMVIGNIQLRLGAELAYDLFVKNMRESLIMGLVSVGLGGVLLASILAISLLGTVLFAPLGLVSYLIFAKTGVVAVSIVGIIFISVIILALLSWYESFLQTVWVLFFKEISLEKQKDAKKEEKAGAEGEIPAPEAI